MTAPRFRLVGIAVKPNVRGHEMRLVTFVPVPSEAFISTEDASAEDAQPPDPEGHLQLLVSVDYAKHLQIGDEVALEKR